MRFNLPEISPPRLISALRSYDLLPAIVFVPSRRRCDEAATEVALDRSIPTDHGKKEAREQIYNEYLKSNPEIKNHKHTKIMLRAGVASHHAGHIPSWKLLIETMMSEGLLNAIFATSTVAAGVDFPARSVVVTNADTRGNDGWRPLFASELQQMTGRAGRRGRDNVGYVILAPSKFQNPPQIAELLDSPPDPLESKFRSTYSSLLNLLDAFGSFQHVRAIAEKSFAFRNTAKDISRLRSKARKRTEELEAKIADYALDLSTDDVRAIHLLVRSRKRLVGRIPQTREELRLRWLRMNVREGRVIARGKAGSRLFLVLNVHGDNLTAMKENGQGVTFALSRVSKVYDRYYTLQDESIDDAFAEVLMGKNELLKEPVFADDREEVDAAVEVIDSQLKILVPGVSPEKARGYISKFWNDADFLERTEHDIEEIRNSIWLPFENRARVLNEFDYLDFEAQKVTESGKWLADLRLDRPLLVGEALREGIFANMEVPVVAGFMACLAADADRDYGELHISDALLDTIENFESTVRKVAKVEWQSGVEPAEEINYSAAATVEAWASGMEWDELVYKTRAEEGDLVRLLSRTGEALRQVAHLGESNAKSAAKAWEASDVMLREPIR